MKTDSPVSIVKNGLLPLVGKLDLKVSKAFLPNKIRIRGLVLMFHRNHASELLELLHLPLGYI